MKEVNVMVEYPQRDLYKDLPQMVYVLGNHTSLTSEEFKDWVLNLSPFWRYLKAPIAGEISYTMIETSMEAKEFMVKLKKHTLKDGSLVELREPRNPLMTTSEIESYFNKKGSSLKIFLKDVSKRLKKRELQTYFTQFGRIKSFKIVERPDKAANIAYMEFHEASACHLVLALRHNVFVGRKEVILPLIMTNDELGAKFDQMMKRSRRQRDFEQTQYGHQTEASDFGLAVRLSQDPNFKLLKRGRGFYAASASGYRPLEVRDHPSNLRFNYGSGYKSNRDARIHPQRLQLHQQRAEDYASMNGLPWIRGFSGQNPGMAFEGGSWGKCQVRPPLPWASQTPCCHQFGCLPTCSCSPQILARPKSKFICGQLLRHPLPPKM